MQHTVEELEVLTEKQARVIKSYEQDLHRYMEIMKVQDQAIKLLMGGSDSLELRKCLKWLSRNVISPPEEEPSKPKPKVGTIRSFLRVG